LAAIAAALLTGALAAPSAATPALPDPAPGGPAHPVEPEVEGPANIDTLDAAVRPDGGTRDGILVTFDRRSSTASGEKPAAPGRFVFLFDKSISFHPEHFPTCDRETIETAGPAACPPESLVGTGRAETYGQDGAAEVKVFNTTYKGDGRGVLITIPATGAIFENTLEQVSVPYRPDYRWAFDELIVPSSTSPQERPASSRFTVEFGATREANGTTYSFAESTAPPGRSLDFGLWSRFVTGQVVLPTARS
jgi:hypothetical protein